MNFRNTLSTQPSHFTDCFPLQWGLFPFVVGIVPLYNGENSPRNKKKYGEFKLGKRNTDDRSYGAKTTGTNTLAVSTCQSGPFSIRRRASLSADSHRLCFYFQIDRASFFIDMEFNNDCSAHSFAKGILRMDKFLFQIFAISFFADYRLKYMPGHRTG